MRILLLITLQLISIAGFCGLSVSTTPVSPSCHNACDGSVTAAATGGTSPYQFSIDGGTTWQTTTLFSGLCSGTYTVTVEDASTATATSTATVTNPATLTFTATPVNASAYLANDGKIVVSASGGTPTYTYTITTTNGCNAGSYTSSPIFNLCPGTYTVTATDSHNCGATGAPLVVTIGYPSTTSGSNPPGINNVSGALAGCNTTYDISIIASGGVAPLQYSDDGGSSWYSSSTFISYHLYCPSSNVQVCVKGSDGSETCETVMVNVQCPLSLATASTNSNCTCNGSITLTGANGGGSGYYYSIDNGSTYTFGSTSYTFTNLCSGTYQCKMTGGTGCTDGPVPVVVGQTSLNVLTSQTNVNCNGASTGSATATPSGGTGSYTYSWSPSGGNGATASNLAAGTYTCTVTDAAPCTTTASVTITQPAPIVVTLALHPDTVCVQAAPYALTGGSPSGGNYSGTGIIGNNLDPNAAGIGAMLVTYTEGSGCNVNQSETIYINNCVTGIAEQGSHKAAEIYPNPTQGDLNIDLNISSFEKPVLIIYDILGHQVSAIPLIANHTALHQTGLIQGMYFYQIMSGKGLIASGKITQE